MGILSRIALLAAIWGAASFVAGVVRHDRQAEKLGYSIFGIAGAVYVLAALP
jgi:hypothetical protein